MLEKQKCAKKKVKLAKKPCGCFSKKRLTKSKRTNKPTNKGGMPTINPFFNFLRVFRAKHCKMAQKFVAIEGAKIWNAMSDLKKLKYYKIAYVMQKKMRKKGRKRKYVKKRRCKSQLN